MTMTSSALLARVHDGGVGDDDPAAKPTRRRFSAEYKLAVLDEYERLTDPDAKGALLRREGLYSSHIVEWRRARDVGALKELASKARPALTASNSSTASDLRMRAWAMTATSTLTLGRRCCTAPKRTECGLFQGFRWSARKE
jgi:transposase-like protein